MSGERDNLRCKRAKSYVVCMCVAGGGAGAHKPSVDDASGSDARKAMEAKRGILLVSAVVAA